MPRVGHWMFNEDSYGRGQANMYAKLSGLKVASSPKLDAVIKGKTKAVKGSNTTAVIEWYGEN